MPRTLLALTLALFGAAADALGCACAVVITPGEPLLSDGRPAPTPQELRYYPVIFLGRAISSVPLAPPVAPDGPFVSSGTVTQFEVLRSWGASTLQATVPVVSPSPGGACGFTFVPGDCYLVFASIPHGPELPFPTHPGFDTLWTHICTPTAPMPVAHERLAAVHQLLGSGTTPSQ
jgi:hypothetical protein